MKIGVSNLYYAEMLDEVAETYDTPVAIEGVSSIDVGVSSTNLKFYADNTLYINNMYVGDLEVSIDTADISAEILSNLLGRTQDVNDVVTATLEDVSPYVAIGYKELDHNGNETYVWLLKGRFQVQDETIRTKGKEPEAQPTTIVGNFIGKKSNGRYRIKTGEGVPGYKDVSATWFTASTLESV